MSVENVFLQYDKTNNDVNVSSSLFTTSTPQKRDLRMYSDTSYIKNKYDKINDILKTEDASYSATSTAQNKEGIHKGGSRKNKRKHSSKKKYVSSSTSSISSMTTPSDYTSATRSTLRLPTSDDSTSSHSGSESNSSTDQTNTSVSDSGSTSATLTTKKNNKTDVMFKQIVEELSKQLKDKRKNSRKKQHK